MPAISFAIGSKVAPLLRRPSLVNTVSLGKAVPKLLAMLVPVPPKAARLDASAAIVGSTPAASRFCCVAATLPVVL
jgi:hypothetical protein